MPVFLRLPFDFGQTESKDEQNACIIAALCLEVCIYV